MPKYSVYSYTANQNSRNSAELHRADFHGNEAVVELVLEEKMKQGHTIVACLEVGDSDVHASGRRVSARESR